MDIGHCFISYSNADGLDFATKLATDLEGGHPFIKVWFDKNEMSSSGGDWDDQISSAISNCKCLLFVMSEDSTAKQSNCKEEWTWALKCKRPVICLVIGENFEEQYRLNNRQKIYFTNIDAGMAQLKLAIARLDSVEGELDELNHRLAEANRDLHRAKDENKPRIQTEIAELTIQINRQEEIVRNPKAAEKRTEDNIQSGLERERKPEKPTVAQTTTKFINPPPGIAPNYFQDRLIESKQIVDFLNNDSKRLMTVVGRAGVGKTALICRLLKGIESGQLPDELGEMKADGIVYLSEAGSHRVNFANIFADLSKLLSNEVSSKLESLYKNPQTSTVDKMLALLDAFSNGRIILLLDNFEDLIDSERLNVKDSELSDALNALLHAPQHTVKVIMTTRMAPRDLALVEPGRQRPLNLDEGLESPYAENVLREMDADGRVGLKTAPDVLLNKAREKTRGYPRALEALYAILSVDRYTTLEELLEISLPEEVVQKLVGEAFNRLDPSAQKVMQALAVYNRPVSPAAIDYLLQPHLPSIDSALVLNRLVNMHFARREAGRYYLHPADKEYAFSIIPVEEELTAKTAKHAKKYKKASSRALRLTNAFTQHDLLNRAADYFTQARKPRAKWKKLDDLAAQLAEFDLRCEAGDFDTAASVLRQIYFNYLHLWGHYHLAIELQLRIKDKIVDENLRVHNINDLGLAQKYIGKVKESIDLYQHGLETSREIKNRDFEGTLLGNLGAAYSELVETQKAIEFHEQALVISRETGSRDGEAAQLSNLGACYSDLGEVHKAIEFHERALAIHREIGNRDGEAINLGWLGNCYSDLGETQKAIEFIEQSLTINREIGDRTGEASKLRRIANHFLSLDEFQKAEEIIKQALQISDELASPLQQNYSRYALACLYLFQNDLINARATIEAALQYDAPNNNHNSIALHGIIVLRQGEGKTAQEAFTKSIAQANEILAKTPEYYSALDAKGLSICGLLICDLRLKKDDLRSEAIETFMKAREIAPHAGVIKSVLRLFDELVKCDEGEILKDVRNEAEGIQ